MPEQSIVPFAAIRDRIAELENAKAAFVAMAQREVVAYDARIAELKRLIEPPAGKPVDSEQVS
jgi:hypothetical protein